jgi:acetolactate synthase-1/3 small subunit
MGKEMQKHTISVLVENRFGVLARVAGLFSGRGYNIDSLTVAETESPDVSRMTITVRGDEKILEQITKQLNKLVDVIKVSDITSEDHVERELALIKVSADRQARVEIIQIVNIFRCHIVDVSPESLVIEAIGDEEKINAIINLLKPYGIRELVRTGKAAITRG